MTDLELASRIAALDFDDLAEGDIRWTLHDAAKAEDREIATRQRRGWLRIFRRKGIDQ